MAYFNKAFLDFFRKLSRNNSKEWMDKNRETYETEVKEPFKVFVTEMIKRVQNHDPRIQVEPKHVMFRINRDIRFSNDKTPYKAHASAAIAEGGKKSSIPGFYFQLSHKGIWVGGGAWSLEKENLNKVRSEISYNMDEFSKLIKAKEFKSKYGKLVGEVNKVIPAEYREDAKIQPLLYNKELYYMTEMDASFILKPNLADHLTKYYLAGKELNEFFRRAIVD